MSKIENKIKILIVDDHQVLRKGLINLLHCNNDFQVIQEANNGIEAISVLEQYNIDVAFLDIEMPVMNGRETLLKIKKKFPSTKVIMFTSHNELFLSNLYLTEGADAFLVKNSSYEKICETIYNVLNDKNQPKINDISNKKISDEHFQLALSQIELEVLKLICENKNGNLICKTIGISHNTLKYYRKSIYSKTRTSSLPELIIYSIKQGIISINKT